MRRIKDEVHRQPIHQGFEDEGIQMGIGGSFYFIIAFGDIQLGGHKAAGILLNQFADLCLQHQ